MSHPPSIKDLIRQALAEDGTDVTSEALIPADTTTTAIMRAREDGVIAGLDVAIMTFQLVDPTLQITAHQSNGDFVSKRDNLLSITGSARAILKAERVALNFASHLSGIATLTRRYVDAVSGTKAHILDTRKTLPALRTLQKEAVLAGGGTNHRFGLDDAILIKDNHIAVAGSIAAALECAKQSKANVNFIEIEVDTLDQLQEVLAYHNTHGGVDIVMLDNMTPAQLKEAVNLVDGRLQTEASGGVTLDSVRAIAESGVDRISIGALTHSVRALDIGLDIDL